MTQTVRSKWVLFVATLNAVFALAVGGIVVYGLRAVRPAPAPVQQLACPAHEPDPQLTQTLQLLAAEQQTLVLRALQPAPRQQATRSARRPTRRPRPLRPVCRR